MKRLLKIYLDKPELTGIAFLVILTVIFQVRSGGVFLNAYNLQGMLGLLPEMALVAIGVTLLMICGEFDLSVGSVFALMPMVMGVLLADGWPFALAFPAGLAVALLIGLINGVLTIRFSIPSFITTLGMLFVARSLTVVISGGFPPLIPPDAMPRALFVSFVGPGDMFRASFLWFLGVAILISLLLGRTNFGNWVRATGGFLPAAQSMGIPTARVKIACFVLCSLLAGFAGTIQVMRLGAPLPSDRRGAGAAGGRRGGDRRHRADRRDRHDLRRHHRRGADPGDRQRPRAQPGGCQLVQDGARHAHGCRGDPQFLAAQPLARDPGGDGEVSAQGPIIQTENLHKWYSGVHALTGVTLDIHRDEALGLVGDNGAGKSTLINILSGIQSPDEGTIRFDGRPVRFRGPRDAMERGIETIYQYNSMVPTMSIARNVFIGREPLRRSVFGIGVLDRQKMRDDSVKAIADVDLHLRSPDALVGELSGGQRQGVAIARAMHFRSKVMILDEPTNHLAVKETQKVIGFVQSLAAMGVTAVFISHNIHHVFECCDRIVAMARGEVVLDRRVGETSMDEIHSVL